MNYFAHTTVAERYARHRPFFHPHVIRQIKTFLKLDQPVRCAVDVACGTGHSAVALKEIAASIVGADISPEMLAQAVRDASIQYLVAPAENLPLQDESADLLTCSMAFHWFDQQRFLRETHRVLRPRGWMVLYGNNFIGEMLENPDYKNWNSRVYVARFPPPPRRQWDLMDKDAEDYGFKFVERAGCANEVSFSREELTGYLLTHSNVIAQVEAGSEPLADVTAWLTNELAPLFTNERGTFLFHSPVWYLQKWTMDNGRWTTGDE